MSVTIRWSAEDSTATSYDLEISDDGGISYAVLDSVLYDTNGADYDARTKEFFYVHAAGEPGFIYKLVANGLNGTSAPTYIVAPPLPTPMCLIVGYITSVDGNVDTNVPVNIHNYGSRGENWVPGNSSQIGRDARRALIIPGTITVYPSTEGMWQVELVQGTQARIVIDAAGFDQAFEVPRQSGPTNIRDIAPLRSQGALYGTEPGDQLRLPES